MKRHTIAIVGLAAFVIAAVTAVTTPTTPPEQAQRNDDDRAGTPTTDVHATGTPTTGEEG